MKPGTSDFNLPKCRCQNFREKCPVPDSALSVFNEFTNIQLELIKVEREMIKGMHQSGKVNEILGKLQRVGYGK
jgi:hypothetical protein